MAAFGYTLDKIRTVLAQWDKTLSDSDLSSCAENGQFYQKALNEIQTALLAAGYNPTASETPLAYQASLDLLIDGIALYFIESKRAASYPEGFNNLAGMWGRYRRNLSNIAGGGRWGEFPFLSKRPAAVFSPARTLSFDREL